jgi:hypothetical protein
MKRSVKKAKTPVFTIKHKNTVRGSLSENTTFKLTYFKREDAERSSAYLTSLGVAHTLAEPKLAA